MSDNMMPELTLNPTEAAQEAVPELTLTPDAPEPEQEQKKEVEPVKVDESMLSEQEKKAVDEFAQKIDIKAQLRRGRAEERGDVLGKCPLFCAQQGSGRRGRNALEPRC